MSNNRNARKVGPAPEMVAETAPETVKAPETGTATAPETGTATAPETGTGTEKPSGGMFSKLASGTSERLAAKASAVTNAKQRLAMACDYFKQGKDKSKEATAEAEVAGLTLVKACLSGVLTPAEMSAAIGDVFGYKLKSDGKPGKTPDGDGEVIRKRIVRAIDAGVYVLSDGKTATRFFDGLPVEEIDPVCAQLETGAISLFTAYDRLAEIKREHTAKREMAFSAKTIGDIVTALCAADAAERIKADKDLLSEYAKLHAILTEFERA